MKPFFMRFKQGDKHVLINMNQVCTMYSEGTRTFMTFNGIIDDSPGYIIVDDSLDDIAQRSDWSQR
jgi:hypothetical protein